jgi:hypothetical protein
MKCEIPLDSRIETQNSRYVQLFLQPYRLRFVADPYQWPQSGLLEAEPRQLLAGVDEPKARSPRIA